MWRHCTVIRYQFIAQIRLVFFVFRQTVNGNGGRTVAKMVSRRQAGPMHANDLCIDRSSWSAVWPLFDDIFSLGTKVGHFEPIIQIQVLELCNVLGMIDQDQPQIWESRWILFEIFRRWFPNLNSRILYITPDTKCNLDSPLEFSDMGGLIKGRPVFIFSYKP